MAEETRRIAAFAADLALERLPDDVTARARRLALDFFGNMIRGSRDAPSAPAIGAAVEAMGLGGPGSAAVAGRAGPGVAPPVAAFLNAAHGHALDFDDTHAAASLHPSAPVVPAALAAAQMAGADLGSFLAAVVAGYDVTCRLGLALDPTAHYARGFHPTATAGTFGATTAAGRLMGLDADGLVSALGFAGARAAGTMQFIVNGAWTKHVHVGAAASAGLMAAGFAKAGVKGSVEALEGRHGFLAGYSGGADPARLTQGLGETFETLRIGLKLYPSCRYSHAPLDGLATLRARLGLELQDVRRLTVRLHRNGVALVAGNPRPRSIVEGQFSMAFLAAVMLDQGRFGWSDFARLGEPDLDAFAQRVAVREDPELESRPHPFSARLELETADGVHTIDVADPSGEPTAFPDDGTVKGKFLALAEPILAAKAGRLAEALLHGPADLPMARIAELATPDASTRT